MKEETKKETEKNDLKYKHFKLKLKSGALYLSKLSKEELIEWGMEMKRCLKDHEEEIFQLKRKNEALEKRLDRYEPKEGSSPDYTGYKKDWPYIKKVQFILQRNYGPLTSNQVLKELLAIEPIYSQMWVDPLNCLSKILGRACKHQLLEKKRIPGSIGLFYHLCKV